MSRVNYREDELLNSYLKDIAKYKVLDSSEIAVLISKAQAGDKESRDKVVTSNLRFVVSIAKQFQNRGIELVDLISAGVCGLIESIDKFDVNRGTTFLTYAGWWIKQCIYNTIYSEGDKIRLPVSQRLLIIKILDATTKFVQEHSKKPTSEEISELTGIDVSQVNLLSQFSNKILSIEDFVGEDGTQLKDIIPEEGLLLDEEISRNLIMKDLDNMLEILPDKEHDVIRMVFGIGMNQVNTKQIASMLGVCRERVRQIKESGLNKLKRKYYNQLKELI